MVAEPEFVEELLHEDEAGRSNDIDKAWHGIHFLLTGKADEVTGPLGFLLSGGLDVSAEPGDLPIARVLEAHDVKVIAQALLGIDAEELRRRFDPAKLEEAEIYPSIWQQDDFALDYLVENFDILKEAVLKAALEGDAMLIELG